MIVFARKYSLRQCISNCHVTKRIETEQQLLVCLIIRRTRSLVMQIMARKLFLPLRVINYTDKNFAMHRAQFLAFAQAFRYH